MSKMSPSLQKLHGAYYTPIEIVNFLTKWAIQTKKDKLLEPSFGGGVFLSTRVSCWQYYPSTPCWRDPQSRTGGATWKRLHPQGRTHFSAPP